MPQAFVRCYHFFWAKVVVVSQLKLFIYQGDGSDTIKVAGITEVTGAGMPVDIWTAFMKGALEGQKVIDFPKPAGLGDDEFQTPTTAPTTIAPTTTAPTTVAPTTAPPTTAPPTVAPTKAPQPTGPPNTFGPTDPPPAQAGPVDPLPAPLGAAPAPDPGPAP